MSSSENNTVQKPKKLGLIIMCVILVILIIVNVAGSMFANVLTQFFAVDSFDKEATSSATSAAHIVSEKVSSEGIVLLENKNGALPLDITNEKEKNVNIFGWFSTLPLYAASSSAAGNNENAVSLYDGLENAGFKVNDELYDFYANSKYKNGDINAYGMFSMDYVKTQVPVSEYPEDLWQKTRDFSDVAIVMISRTGGEGISDIPTDMTAFGGGADEHYLELSTAEKEMFAKIESLNFAKVIVLINAGQPMELDFLEANSIDAGLWIGYMGEDGMSALGKLINGEISPSGRLADTYAYDAMSSPAYQNHGKFEYSNAISPNGSYGQGNVPVGYLNYTEGIYVGYRYYETRFVDNETGEVDEAVYSKVVQYPFGYGLSYTEFSQEIADFKNDGGNITMSVKVTNTGSAPAKEVVQVYYTAPYTVGGIEKSHVVLIDFDKTETLNPGESETMTMSFTEEDMASFDYKISGSYVLEEGDYEIKLMKNSHEVIDSRTHSVAKTVVYGEDNKRSTDIVPAVSQFEDIIGTEKRLSRGDWDGSFPNNPPRSIEASEEIIFALADKTLNDDPNTPDITIQSHGIKLPEMAGLDFDDPKWDQFMEQVEVEDMRNLIGFGGFSTLANKDVGLPYTVDLDGPGGIKALVREGAYDTVGYPSAVVLASTWNEDLILEMARAFGKEANAWGVSGLYAPTMNIRRLPFGGRNSEYFSEDPFISARMATAYTKGIQESNVYVYIKHFVTFEQITNAQNLCTWVDEQALREIYLKPFEVSVKEGDAKAVMSCYNLLGTTWSGASVPLLQNVLREEWGFRGMVISDYFMGVMDPDKGIRSGNDLMLSTVGNLPQDNGPAARQAMRTSSKNIMYTIANSNAIEIDNYGPFPYWIVALVVIDVIFLALFVLFIIRRNKKVKAYNESSSVKVVSEE